MGCWIDIFLDSSTRQQTVVVDGRDSPLTQVVSGVSHGTVLVPFLFLIHIRDVDNDNFVSEKTTASS